MAEAESSPPRSEALALFLRPVAGGWGDVETARSLSLRPSWVLAFGGEPELNASSSDAENVFGSAWTGARAWDAADPVCGRAASAVFASDPEAGVAAAADAAFVGPLAATLRWGRGCWACGALCGMLGPAVNDAAPGGWAAVGTSVADRGVPVLECSGDLETL